MERPTILLIYSVKLWQNSHLLLMKTLIKIIIEVNFFNLVKSEWKKSTADIILNCEIVTTFLLRSETTLGHALSSVLSDIATGGSSQCNKARNRKHKDWKKEEAKASWFTDNMIIYVKISVRIYKKAKKWVQQVC